jgi:hypothetical protein
MLIVTELVWNVGILSVGSGLLTLMAALGFAVYAGMDGSPGV